MSEDLIWKVNLYIVALCLLHSWLGGFDVLAVV